MDDSAHRKPPAPEQGPEPRVSSVKSIISPRQGRSRHSAGPTLPAVLASLTEAQRETTGPTTDENILRAYVHALERLYPTVRFAMRLSRGLLERSAIVQATTHHIGPTRWTKSRSPKRGSFERALRKRPNRRQRMVLRRTYEPILLAGPGEELLPTDGLDVALARAGEVFGVLAAEFERGAELPSRFEDALLMAATQASAAIECGRLRRESLHLRDYLEKLLGACKHPRPGDRPRPQHTRRERRLWSHHRPRSGRAGLEGPAATGGAKRACARLVRLRPRASRTETCLRSS